MDELGKQNLHMVLTLVRPHLDLSDVKNFSRVSRACRRAMKTDSPSYPSMEGPCVNSICSKFAWVNWTDTQKALLVKMKPKGMLWLDFYRYFELPKVPQPLAQTQWLPTRLASYTKVWWYVPPLGWWIISAFVSKRTYTTILFVDGFFRYWRFCSFIQSGSKLDPIAQRARKEALIVSRVSVLLGVAMYHTIAGLWSHLFTPMLSHLAKYLVRIPAGLIWIAVSGSSGAISVGMRVCQEVVLLAFWERVCKFYPCLFRTIEDVNCVINHANSDLYLQTADVHADAAALSEDQSRAVLFRAQRILQKINYQGTDKEVELLREMVAQRDPNYKDVGDARFRQAVRFLRLAPPVETIYAIPKLRS